MIPVPCYFTLGATEADVALHEWQNFSNRDLDAANACAEWIAKQIAAEAIWPPAEKVDYDDFATLTAGKNFEEMFTRNQPMDQSHQEHYIAYDQGGAISESP